MVYEDKIKHFVACLLGTAFIAQILAFFLTQFWALLTASQIMLLVGIAKEFYDKFIKTPPTGFNWFDILADIAGIGAAVFILGVL